MALACLCSGGFAGRVSHKPAVAETAELRARALPFVLAPMRALPSREALVLMVSPFAPHLGEECWELLRRSDGGSGGDSPRAGLTYAPWVEWSEELCASEVVSLGVQVSVAPVL